MSAEVTEVVRLVLDHARTRPGESLGVIALGVKHAERVDTALRAVLTAIARGDGGAAGPAGPPAGPARPPRGASDPDVPYRAGSDAPPVSVRGDRDLEAFFAEDVPEPFFVKNLERVQGDERDAIIISVGYGKHPDGRMRYQWGPLLRDGGERRLNVAATRARRRLTVVSSFSSHDVDPSRLTAPGARMLADYLEYARAGGVPVAPEPASSVSHAHGSVQPQEGSAGDAGAFHSDVAASLAELGINVVPQYGVGGYRVDFAAAHPDDPSRMILAIEADGAGYRASGSVRDRDRLRKEHLERLGWRVHRLWSTAWFTDPAGELAKLRAAFDSAVSATPPPPPAPSPPAPETRTGSETHSGTETAAEEPDTWTTPASRPSPEWQHEASSQAGPPPQPDEPPRHEDESWAGEEPWPQAVNPARVVRVIPLGPGERPRLRASAARALPAPGAAGPAALPPGSEPGGDETGAR